MGTKKHIYSISPRYVRLYIHLPVCLDCGRSILMLLTTLVLGTVAIMLDSDYQQTAYAQENSTAILDDVRTQLRSDRQDLSEIKNMTARETAILNEINLTSTKLATQGAYTALSVFFLGIALVIFGLRLTTKGIAHLGKYFTMMVWALTLPVVVLIATFQIVIVTNSSVRLVETDEPFFVLSFLMYIPIGIILFLLIKQKQIMHSQPVKEKDQTKRNLVEELEQIFTLKEKGLISGEEYQRLKTELLADL